MNLFKDVTPVQIVTFVAISAAGWILYKLFDQISAGAGDVGDSIGDAIAPLFVGPAVSVNAAAVLPDGRSVPFNDIVAAGGSLKSLGGDLYVFTYQGISYRVVPPRRADGRYNAVRV